MTRSWMLLASLAALLSGCLAHADETIDANAQPSNEKLDPRSLRVGDLRDGDYLRWQRNATGNGIRYSCTLSAGCQPQLVDVTDTTFNERWVVAGNTSKDAWLRPVDAIVYKYRYTDLTPSQNQRGTYEGDAVYERATGRMVNSGNDWYGRYTVYSCQIVCLNSNAITYDWNNDGRYYPRNTTNATFGDLSGRVLRVGQTISFHDIVDGWDDQYHVFLNYTAVKLVTLHGDRAMVVRPSSEIVRVHPEPSGTPAATASAASSPSASRLSLEKTPERTLLLWFNASVAGPVKMQSDTPFRFEGKWYWSNLTSEVVEGTRGNEPIHWGTERPTTLAWMPGIGHQPFADFWKSFEGSGLTLTPAKAQEWLLTDPLALSYQQFRASNPQAYPFWSMYYPDVNHNAYTWSGYTGSNGNPSNYWAEARLQATPLGGGVGLMQSQGGGVTLRGFGAAPASTTQGLELASGADLYKTFRSLRPEWAEAAVEVAMYVFGDNNAFNPTVTFHQAQELARDDPVGLLGGYWGSKGNVAFSLRDGGLVHENGSFTIQHSTWPWLPLTQFNLEMGSPVAEAAASPFPDLALGGSLVGVP